MAIETIRLVTCDRSGRTIQHLLQEDVEAFSLHAPWCPSVHNRQFIHLCDEDRTTLAGLFARLFKLDVGEVVRTSIGNDGKTLKPRSRAIAETAK